MVATVPEDPAIEAPATETPAGHAPASEPAAPQPARPRLSVVVPTYNEAGVIGECLTRLTAQADHIAEIIVVDNNSTDDGMRIVGDISIRHPTVRIVHEREQGLVYARNTGLDAATGDIIARIDADTRVPEHWARTIVDFFAADTGDEWAALCGRGEAYGIPYSGRFDRWKIALHPLSRGKATTPAHPSEPGDVPVLYGSNMILRRDTWQTIRTRVSMRRDVFEDVDMGLCVRETGGRNAFLASITVGVSPRRMETGIGSFVRYMSCLPRTFLLHRQFGLALGAAAVYLPAITVLHTGRLLLLRSYDAESGTFSLTNVLRERTDRIMP